MVLQKNMFNSKQELYNYLKEEVGISGEEKIERIAETVMEEARTENGDPEQLLQRIENGAKSLMTDIGLETVSWVQNPSQDSMFVMMKNNDNRIKKTTSIYY